jgi:phage gpG-like protein
MATSIEQAIRNLQQLKRELNTIVGNEMVNQALDNIRDEKDVRGMPMKPRKPGSVRNIGRKLLVDTGRGRRSIKDKATGNTVSLTAEDYMVAHNEGVNKTVSARSRKGTVYTKKMNLPQREFAGVPQDRINKVIANRIAKACA